MNMFEARVGGSRRQIGTYLQALRKEFFPVSPDGGVMIHASSHVYEIQFWFLLSESDGGL